MAKQIVLSVVLLAALACSAHASFGRQSFPKGFVFGTGSASYQVMHGMVTIQPRNAMHASVSVCVA
jgi:hypothetical protein